MHKIGYTQQNNQASLIFCIRFALSLHKMCYTQQYKQACFSAFRLHYRCMKTKNEMTIKEAQDAVDTWIKQYGVRYFSELTNMTVLTEEVGELARVMARKYGDQSFKEGEKDNTGEEIADIFWVLCCIANQTGIDITEEFKKSIDKKTKRDKERHKNNQKLK